MALSYPPGQRTRWDLDGYAAEELKRGQGTVGEGVATRGREAGDVSDIN